MGYQGRKSIVVIIDVRILRRAGIVSLLAEWADSKQLDILATARVDRLKRPEAAANYQMIVYSSGEQPIGHPDSRKRLEYLRAMVPDARLVIISDRDTPEDMVAAISAGAHGFIPTSMDPSLTLEALSFIVRGGSFFPTAAVLLSTERACEISTDTMVIDQPVGCEVNGAELNGDPLHDISSFQHCSPARCHCNLTDRQQQVMELVCEGMPNKVIARELCMTEATVKVHVRQIMRKLGVTNRTQIAIRALREKPALPALSEPTE